MFFWLFGGVFNRLGRNDLFCCFGNWFNGYRLFLRSCHNRLDGLRLFLRSGFNRNRLLLRNLRNRLRTELRNRALRNLLPGRLLNIDVQQPADRAERRAAADNSPAARPY